MALLLSPMEIGQMGFGEEKIKEIKDIECKIQQLYAQLESQFDGESYFFSADLIDEPLVRYVYQELRSNYKMGNNKLNVVLICNGGETGAAYKIGLLLRRYGKKELNFYIPTLAKSAATLLALSGDHIYISPIGELGPLDMQYPINDPMRNQICAHSSNDIMHTLEIVQDSFNEGQREMANALLDRMTNPFWLAQMKHSGAITVEYLQRLMSKRMFSEIKDKAEQAEKILSIAERLLYKYPSHDFCIGLTEAQNIGIKASEFGGKKLDLILEIIEWENRLTKLIQG